MSLVMATASFLARIGTKQRRNAYGKQNKTSPKRRVA